MRIHPSKLCKFCNITDLVIMVDLENQVLHSGDSGKCHVSGESGDSGDFGDLCNIYICIGYILPTIREYICQMNVYIGI